MYWFAIQEVLEENKEPMTSFDIYEAILEQEGRANLNNTRKTLKKLVEKKEILLEEEFDRNEGVRRHLYVLNSKNI